MTVLNVFHVRNSLFRLYVMCIIVRLHLIIFASNAFHLKKYCIDVINSDTTTVKFDVSLTVLNYSCSVFQAIPKQFGIDEN